MKAGGPEEKKFINTIKEMYADGIMTNQEKQQLMDMLVKIMKFNTEQAKQIADTLYDNNKTVEAAENDKPKVDK